VTNYNTYQISHNKVLIGKTNPQKRLLSKNTHCPLKAETQEHPSFGQYVFNNTKALTKVTKDHQKKPKKPYYNYHLHKIDSYNQ
jgi:hypothetical protein